MPVLHKDQRVVCVCRYGQVRSVCTRYILTRLYSFRRVIACGWENTDAETLTMLYDWTDIIIVVGRGTEWKLTTPPKKTLYLEVGSDVWHDYRHPDLISRVLNQLTTWLFD